MDPDTIRRLQLHISRLRGLEFKTDLKVGIKQKDELKSKMMEPAEKASLEDDEKVRKALVKLGFVPADLNLRQFMIDLYVEQIAGFYDKTIRICGRVNRCVIVDLWPGDH